MNDPFKRSPTQLVKKQPTNPSEDENAWVKGECSLFPRIVPSSIKEIRCSVRAVPLERMISRIRSEEDQARAESAAEFLFSIPTNHEIRSKVSASLAVKGKGEESYESPMSGSFKICSQIDLSEFPSKLKSGPLKSSLNREFAEKYPFIDKALSLSKILSLREKLIGKVLKLDIDICTFAAAWTCFLFLVEKGHAKATNRNLLSATCLVLAYKFFEESHLSTSKKRLKKLLKSFAGLDSKDNFGKEVIKHELKVYALLRFSLSVCRYQDNFDFALRKVGLTHKDYFSK